jgi:CIC family chloride channel protein
MKSNWLRKFRLRLAHADSLLHFSVIGVLSGITCALVMFAFRSLIELPSSFWLPESNPENFEDLPSWLHFLLPVIGALLIGLVLRSLSDKERRTGIPHVITRLHAHHGQMPLKNALFQFFGGAFALATGQSGGREGPAIHLGAAANSLLGKYFYLPHNSTRILVGCGTAAAIAASFNTPIAGVILAMEVVMMEYTIAGFTPIILSAITATTLTRVLYGNEAIFQIPALEMASLWELPFIAFLGLATGACAALFIVILKASARQSSRPIMQRMLAAGLLTGACAVLVPEVMGIGYDTLNQVLAGEVALTLLLAIIAAKILATSVGCGLGLPIGMIGPNLLIGACIGGALGLIGTSIFPDLASNQTFYVILGMGAMMGAILNAPLAALMALLELSQNPSIIFPGMLAITVATLTNSEIFKQKSAHQTVLEQLREVPRTDPLSLALQRTSVASLMSTDFQTAARQLLPDQAKILLDTSPEWFLIDDQNGHYHLIEPQDLHQSIEAALVDCDSTVIDLVSISHQPQKAMVLHSQATLREALDLLDQHKINALYISGYLPVANRLSPLHKDGLLLRRDIETYYQSPQQT